MTKSEIKTEIDEKLNSKTNQTHTINLNKNYQITKQNPLDSGLNKVFLVDYSRIGELGDKIRTSKNDQCQVRLLNTEMERDEPKSNTSIIGLGNNS